VRIIKKSTVRGFWRTHPDARPFLECWLLIVHSADWQNLADVRRSYPHADAVKVASGNTVTVFNVAGNKYRLIVSIKYNFRMVYIRDFLTHATYSKDAWKERH
jgi:mRNA interferase HigB